MSAAREGLSQKCVFAMRTLGVEGFYAITSFIALSVHLKPLNVLLNFSAFEAVEKPSYPQRENLCKTEQEDD